MTVKNKSLEKGESGGILTMRFDTLEHRVVSPEEALQLIPAKRIGRFYELKKIVFDLVSATPKGVHVFTTPKGMSDKDATAGMQAMKAVLFHRGLKNWTVSWNSEKRLWLVYQMETFRRNSAQGGKK
jgi:hypothetical protein